MPGTKFVLFALALFIPMVLVEYFWMRRKGRAYPSKEVASSFGVYVGQYFVGLLQAAPYAAVFAWIASFQVTTLSMTEAWHWVALAVGVEFTYYWTHRLGHEIRWFWASHSVHHSTNQYNLPAALRLGWTNVISGLPLLWAPLVLMGFPPAYIFGALGINLAYQFLLHTEAVPKLGRPFEWFFNSPSHHRVHHARNAEYLDANYGGITILFDRLFGTFIEERADLPVDYGLTKRQLSHNPFRIALEEYAVMGKDLLHAPSWKARFLYVFGRPGYSHDGSRETTAMVRSRLGINVSPRSAPMKSSRKILVVASIGMIALLAASCHRFGKRDPEAKAAFINDRISSKLDFDENQEVKLKGVSGEIVAVAKELKAMRDRDRELVIALVREPELDQERVLAAIRERRELIEAKIPAVVARVAELHRTLTPEQREEIVGMIEKHK